MLNVVVGPMYSGKTSSMIANIDDHITIGEVPITIQWSFDSRSGNSSNHSGEKIKSAMIRASDLSKVQHEIEQYDLICIDDAHFFSDLPTFLELNRHRKIFVYGLDTDYMQEQFKHVTDTQLIADSYVKLQGNCGVGGCANKSIYTTRRPDVSGGRLISGNSDVYTPVCLQHAKQGHVQ